MRDRRYWFEFESSEHLPPNSLDCTMPWACGVTALDQQDALDQIREVFAVGLSRNRIKRVVEDVDVTDLAQELSERRIRVDFGSPLTRGIWYPHQSSPDPVRTPFDNERNSLECSRRGLMLTQYWVGDEHRG
jgi:hypothetical protein